ncbi:hypothetical protein SPH9361_04852 [Sphingobium sp. CECT 9361]|nr:hypothetical protein SPH9361_04852 [Sphingobium sp. CECT 9361]
MDRLDHGMGRAIFAALGLRHVELPPLVELICDPAPRPHRFLICQDGIVPVEVLSNHLSDDIMGIGG